MQRRNTETKKLVQHPNGTGSAIYGYRTDGNGNSVSGSGLCSQSWETVLRGGANRRQKGKTLQTNDHFQNQSLRGCNKNIIITSVNPTSMQVGISALKSLRDGRFIMETKSKEDIELLCTNINDKCSQLLEANIQKPRNPRIVIYNIPEELNVENAEDIIQTQNPELMLNAGQVVPKFTYRGKRNAQNMLIEVGPKHARKY